MIRYAAFVTARVVALYRVSPSVARQIAGYVLRGLFCTLTDSLYAAEMKMCLPSVTLDKPT